MERNPRDRTASHFSKSAGPVEHADAAMTGAAWTALPIKPTAQDDRRRFAAPSAEARAEGRDFSDRTAALRLPVCLVLVAETEGGAPPSLDLFIDMNTVQRERSLREAVEETFRGLSASAGSADCRQSIELKRKWTTFRPPIQNIHQIRFGCLYQAASPVSTSTGPESWPRASTSRSTNSMTASGASSP
jgi:hypothetical protein